VIIKGLSEEAVAEVLAEQLALWETISERSHRRLGPPPIKRSVEDLPLDKFLAATTAERRKFSRQSPLGIEYQHDGVKTTAIIAAVLYKKIVNAWHKLNRPADIWPTLSKATQDVLTYFKDRSVARPVEDLIEETPQSEYTPEGLEGWLRQEPLSKPSDLPVQMCLSYSTVDLHYPFIVLKNAHEQSCKLEQQQVYWLGKGLNSTYFDNIPRRDGSRWEGRRLQLTLHNPYILLCNGILRGNEWGQIIDHTLNGWRPYGLKPVLIVLADGVAEGTTFPKDCYSLVLPTPRDEEHDSDNPYIPSRPGLEAMAEAFETQVVRLWRKPKDQEDQEEPNWNLAAAQLGQCLIAQIDRQRTVLLPHFAVDFDADFEPGKRDWRIHNIYTLTLSQDNEETISQAEAMMRWRIEAEEGVVAGAGAAFYWAAHLLDEDVEGSTDPNLDPVQWLQQALRAPLRQLLTNAHIDLDETEGQAVVKWVDSADAPQRTFRFDFTTPFPDAVPSIIRGEAIELQIVTPLPQVRRTIELAGQLAWQLALLHLSQAGKETMEASV